MGFRVVVRLGVRAHKLTGGGRFVAHTLNNLVIHN
jgi:hypothetical protein